jgi:hypothetical protein|tara:strand:- start:1725 stop:2153 length:429 start_codon:yes stop_codon:yes gene_type:complete
MLFEAADFSSFQIMVNAHLYVGPSNPRTVAITIQMDRQASGVFESLGNCDLDQDVSLRFRVDANLEAACAWRDPVLRGPAMQRAVLIKQIRHQLQQANVIGITFSRLTHQIWAIPLFHDAIINLTNFNSNNYLVIIVAALLI